jgi:hypothetical protein
MDLNLEGMVKVMVVVSAHIMGSWDHREGHSRGLCINMGISVYQLHIHCARVMPVNGYLRGPGHGHGCGLCT